MSERETALNKRANEIARTVSHIADLDGHDLSMMAIADIVGAIYEALAAQPVDAPQPCVWRKLPMTGDMYQPDCMGDNFDVAREVFDLQEWKWCPNCGSPLSVVPAAQETTK